MIWSHSLKIIHRLTGKVFSSSSSRLLLLLVFVPFFSLVAVFANPSSTSVSAYDGLIDGGMQINGTNPQYIGYFNNDYIFQPNATISQLTFYYPNYGNGGYYEGQSIVISGSFYFNFTFNSSQKNKVLSVECPVVLDSWFEQDSCTIDSLTDISAERHSFVYNYVITGHSSIDSLTPSLTLGSLMYNFSQDNGAYFYAVPPYVKTSDLPATTDLSSFLSESASYTHQIYSVLCGVPSNPSSTICYKLDSIRDSINSLDVSVIADLQSDTNDKLDTQISLQQQQIDQQQEQYESEKAEESERESDLSDSSSELGAIFNFNVINPFASIWNLFQPNTSCVSIPILSSLLNTNESQFCPVFSSTVRSILTPVIGIFSVILLFGFVVRWLKSDKDNGSVVVS